MLETLFGPPQQWPQQDLIGFSDEFDPGIALLAYRCGVFPMPLQAGPTQDQMGWWSPMERAILPLEDLRVSRSLRKTMKHYSTTVDAAFSQVIARCADRQRPGWWIDQRVIDAFTVLHQAGYVHSVETWDAQGRLVGGLYGVHQNAMFAGESMFHDHALGRDASKVALVRLALELGRIGVDLLDVQWQTDHLQSLGAVTLTREEYLSLLDRALERPHVNAWRSGGGRLPGQALLAGFEAARRAEQ